MKQIFLISTLLIFCVGCQKKTTHFLTVKGRVVDANNNQIVSNFPVQISYINPIQGMGFNLGNWNNISNCITDINGNFTLTTPYAMAKDTDDYYKIEALSSTNYFGFSKSIVAKQAESQ